MKTFIATVKHDNGKMKIKTAARNKTAAIDLIMKAEDCPRSAILSVKLT